MHLPYVSVAVVGTVQCKPGPITYNSVYIYLPICFNAVEIAKEDYIFMKLYASEMEDRK